VAENTKETIDPREEALKCLEAAEPPAATPDRIIQPQAPIPITQTEVELPITQKRDKIVHAMLDAKLSKTPEELKAEFQDMDWDKYSKVFARFKEKDVKVDMNITALGVFALFPVAVQEGLK